MPDTTKISELTPAAQLNNTDLLILTQGTAGNYASLNTTLLALANKIVANTNYTSDLHTNSKTIVGALNEIFNSGNLADTYDTTETYEEDDYCIYQGLLYKCTAQTTGEFDTDDWVQTTITDELAQGGGGGATVIANPTGTPTDNLDTIQIGNVIYDIPGSGGSGGTGGLTKTTLYENASGTLENVISLSQSIEDFDFVEIVTQYPHTDDNDYRQNAIYNTEELIDSIGTARPINWHIGNDSIYTWIYITDVDEITVHTNTQASLGIRYVYGYKVASGGGSANWKDITGILTAGQTEITLYDASITANSTFEPFTDKFGVNPTDMEFISDYRFTDFMDGKITVRENLNDSTDIKLFVNGLTKDANFLPITDTDLLDYLSDITSGYLKACSTYDTADSTTQTGILAIGNWGSGMGIHTYVIGWSQYKAGTFYGVIDLTESPVPAQGLPSYQTNEYENPYSMAGGVKLTFPVQSENLNVKVRVS